MLVAQSCLTLCSPMDCSLLCSSIHQIFQARILGWVAISFSSGSSQPGDWTWVSCFVGRFFINWATTGSIRELNRWKNEVTVCCAKLLQSCRTVCNPMTYSPPGSSVHGILQARRACCHALLQGLFPTQGLNLRFLRPLALVCGFFTTSTNWEALKSLQ